MAQDDPFTLDLFGNTALSSDLGLGVTAFSASFTEGPDDDDPPPMTPAPAAPMASVERRSVACPAETGENFHLTGTRQLARSWKDRARDNLAAIRLAAAIEAAQRSATPEEQTALIKFTGFGASDLANGVFRRPGEDRFRKGWEALGAGVEEAVSSADYASLARCTQYAHFTPEYIVRAIWAGLLRLGWRGGRVLEPGIGTGLFPALMPDNLRSVSHVTGIEIDPVTARIARLLQPRSRIVIGDFARVDLPAHFRSSDRQSALLRPRRALGSRFPVAQVAAARLLHRQVDQPAEAGSARGLCHVARHDGQGGQLGPRAHCHHGRSHRRGPPA